MNTKHHTPPRQPDPEATKSLLATLGPQKFAHYSMTLALAYAGLGSASRRSTFYWRFRTPGFVGLRWVALTEYFPGFVRFRNDMMINPPRTVWPQSLPVDSPDVRFEVTVLPEEVPAIAPALIQWASELPREISHPLLEQGESVPLNYLWSDAAHVAYRQAIALSDAERAARRERRARIEQRNTLRRFNDTESHPQAITA